MSEETTKKPGAEIAALLGFQEAAEAAGAAPMQQPRPDAGAIGGKILRAARNELYMNFPYMDAALCALAFEPAAEEDTSSAATDGETLFYNGKWLAREYMRSRAGVNRAYLHVILHCLLRHIWKARGREPELWDLACDVAVEALLREMDQDKPCIREGMYPMKQKFIAECARSMKVITAEGVYLHLVREGYEQNRVRQLARVFRVDDHGLWDPEEKDDPQQQRQDQNWSDIADRTQTSVSTSRGGMGEGENALAEQIRVAVREGVDYRAFLRRFAAPHEVLRVDTDTFDYIFYTYGLQLYGNMPLIEPVETKEERRIEELVIAVDTSMSTNGDLVREFLACTYAILRSSDTYTNRVNIRILQCDNEVRADDRISDLDDLQRYMEHFELRGGSTTDFRPVFRHVDELIAQGAFTQLRGLIYFTDGMGVYPEKRPRYETAFVMLGEPPENVKVPAWAIKLVLEEQELHRAYEEAEKEARAQAAEAAAMQGEGQPEDPEAGQGPGQPGPADTDDTAGTTRAEKAGETEYGDEH